MLHSSVVFCDRPLLKAISESLLCNTRIVQLDAGFGGKQAHEALRWPAEIRFILCHKGWLVLSGLQFSPKNWERYLPEPFLQIGQGLKVEERLRPQEAMVLHSSLNFLKFNPVSSAQTRLHYVRPSSPGWLNLFSAALDSNLRRLMRMLIVGVWTQSGYAWI